MHVWTLPCCRYCWSTDIRWPEWDWEVGEKIVTCLNCGQLTRIRQLRIDGHIDSTQSEGA